MPMSILQCEVLSEACEHRRRSWAVREGLVMGPRGADFWRRQEEWGQGKVLQAEHTPCRGIEVQEGSVHITPSLLLGP